MYADDLKLYTVIETKADVSRLQNEINAIYCWSKLWQMEISISKTFVMTVGGRLLSFRDYNYLLNCSNLSWVTSTRDLGVTFDSDLSFTQHVNTIVSTASIRANLLHRCFVSGDRNLLLKAFIVFVRPVLEYCSSVWSPRFLRDAEAVESVQRHFTKRLHGLGDKDYNTRLEILKLESLELRRLRADLVFTYKIYFGLIDVDFSDFYIKLSNNNTRGHPYRLFTPQSHNDTRRGFFSVRVLNAWNGLPESTTDFSTLSRFRRSISTDYLVKHSRIGLAH